MDPHAELFAPVAQDGEQTLPADGGEAMPARTDDLAFVMDVDVVPDGEALAQPLVELGVGVFDPAERLV